MKKIYFILSAFIMLFASCSQDELVPAKKTGKASDIQLNITVSSPVEEETTQRAYIKTGWVTNDQIQMWFDTNTQENPDLVIKYDGDNWIIDTDATTSGNMPAASGYLKAVYNGNVAAAVKDNYTYEGNTLACQLKTWTLFTKLQVVVNGITEDAGNYTLSCNRFTPYTGFTVNADGITAKTGAKGGAVKGIKNDDGAAFVFVTSDTWEEDDKAADYNFTLSSLTTSKGYTASTTIAKPANNKIKGLKVNESKFASYLCFTAKANGVQFTLNKKYYPTPNALEYSTNGANWTDLTIGTAFPSTALSTDEKVYVRAKDARTVAQSAAGYVYFSSTGNFDVSGNIMFLVDPTGKATVVNTNYEFFKIFYNCTKLQSAENLTLPATTLKEGCYNQMFRGCSSLTTAPALPATTLAIYCYNQMFQGCSSLTSVPADYLPVTTLAEGCYGSMFEGCTGLTTVPANLLPATTLAENCYNGMFKSCTSLTTAPKLPATTLVDYCYFRMFYGCSSLNSITCLATNIGATECTEEWVSGVNGGGTFKIASSAMEAAWEAKGAYSGKPENFTYSYAE